MQVCESTVPSSLNTRPPRAEVRWLRRIDSETPYRHLADISPTTRVVKRTLDIVLAVGMLLVLAPVMLIMAVMVVMTAEDVYW